MTVPIFITARMDSPVQHAALQGLTNGDDHPQYALRSVVDALLADLGLPNPLPQYVLASLLAAPNGVATLGADGILELAQRPPPAAHFDTTDETTMLGDDTAAAIIGDYVHLADGSMFQLRAPGDHTDPDSWAAFTVGGVAQVDGVNPTGGNVTLPTDADPGTGSKRTLGPGAQQAAAGDHGHDGTYPRLDASNLTDQAHADAISAALGLTSRFEGIECWAFGHSFFNFGGTGQAARFADRVARRLGTVGRLSADAFDLGDGVELRGTAAHNGERTVSFSIDGGGYATPATLPRLAWVPPSNNLDYGAGPLASEPTDRFYGLTNHSRPGFRANAVQGTILAKWVPGTRGLVLLCGAINNVPVYTDAASIAAFAELLRAELRFLRAAPADGTGKVGLHDINGTGGAFPLLGGGVPSGAWAQANYANLYLGQGLQTVSVGGYIDLTVNGDEAIIATLQRDAGELGGSLEITDGASTTYVASFPTVGGFAAMSTTTKWYVRTHRITGLGAGDHLLRVRKTDAFALPVVVDAWWTPTPTPPLVAVVKEHGYTGDPDSWADHMATIDAVVAEPEFAGYCVAIDTATGWDQALMAWGDGVHLGDAGHAHYADRVCTALATLDVELGWREGTQHLQA